jgi:phenylacetate-coenzyme A ligase PaaK-like adenylate-forming protein
MDDIALRLFRYQAHHNPVYTKYISYLGTNIQAVKEVNAIPFLPISFFKMHELKTDSWKAQTFFTSSGTTGNSVSTHHIADLSFYLQHAERCFNHFFGSLHEYHILALMPSYLERENSSLVAMIRSFTEKSESEYSGFYLYEHEKLLQDLVRLKKNGDRKIILWGVSFALLDLAEKYQPDLSGCLVFETGGMKGRRKELTRQELHSQLKKYFNVTTVYSEYGMTELLSQAYTKGEDVFYLPPWMKVVIRESVDPFEKGQIERTGGLNVIDLANFHSIAFIETEDAGKTYANGSFEVMGRLDNTDVRGCNLLVE